jgi:hypothetical protein
MIHNKNKLIMLGLGLVLVAQQLAAFAPTTSVQPYEQAVRFLPVKNKKYRMKVGGEFTTAARGYDFETNRSQPLALYEPDQSMLLMLRNPGAAHQTQVDHMLRLMGNPTDDGVRGHLKLDGSFKEWSVLPSMGASFDFAGILGHFGVDVSVPVRRRTVSLLSTADQTNTSSYPLPEDLRVATQMPNMLSFMQQTGQLSANSWQSTGLGDTTIMLSWRNWFKQDKELVRGVELFAQIGVSLPTGQERDENQAFSMAMGNDGAFGIPLGLGLNVQFVNTLRMGLNLDFLAQLDKTKVRRIKTVREQSDLLLLSKSETSKEAGLQWQFYVYAQSYHFLGGLSAKAAYQFIRRDEDRLLPRGNDYSSSIVNSAKRLDDWYVHNAIFSIDYDHVHSSDALVVPQLSIFYKFPFGGRSVLAAQTVGVYMGVCF